MKRLNSVRSIYRVPLSHSTRWLNKFLHVMECTFSRDDHESLEYVPVFIIGAPRSGSTLLYQVMTDYYDFGYFSNLHCKYYGGPSFVERFFEAQQPRHPSTFSSIHGRIDGQLAPSECGAYWYRFFRRKPQYVPLEEAEPHKMRQMRASIRALGNAFLRPILFKNLMCTLRLSPINVALPEALFIVIRRNIVDNAHSLLEGRKFVYDDYSQWWSAEPPGIERMRHLPPHKQVVEQVQEIYHLIDHERKNIGEHRFIDVQYEEFCSHTLGTLATIDQFFARNMLFVEKRVSNIPPSFTRSHKVRIESTLYRNVVNYVHEQQQ